MNAITNPNRVPRTTSGTEHYAGSVKLVGAGPGAGDLLTLRALKAIESADVIYYDSLVGPDVLDYIKPDTTRVFVGKRKGYSALPQSVIQDRMVRDAKAGKRVVRLKGGDPFTFGRGGEELFDLRAQGVSVDVIPGVTAALAAATEHGIPLTHRDVATSVTFATGHTLTGGLPDLANLVSDKRTLVVYMGVSNAGDIVSQLLSEGVSRLTPVAVVERASLPGQRHIRTSLASLVSDLHANAIGSPALLIIGAVAALDESALDPSYSHQTQAGPADSFAWVHHPMG
ncbi:MAG: uroporphyrinogen-III C-methyltransferase [Rhodospirillaceae bacterium]|jgi:uroporphyrin-III C-methyltransferase